MGERVMKKFCSLMFALILLVNFAGAAQVVNLTGSSEAPAVEVLKSDAGNILLDYRINGFIQDQVIVEGEAYDLIALKSESRLWAKGNPELPRLCRSIMIPDNALMSARVVSSEYRDISGIKVLPSKGHFSREINPGDVPYEFGEIYQQDAWYPQNIVQLRNPYILRDIRGQVVEVNAFQYNPVTQVLRVYTQLTIEVKQVGSGGVNVLERSGDIETIDPEFKRIYDRHFLNYGLDYTPVEEEGSMLVIVHDAWYNAMMPLVNWKNQKGLSTTMVNVGTIGNNATAIKNYIQNLYNTSDLKYVLLVGDAAQVATPSGGEDPTYGYLVGNDHYSELFIGRFSAENLDHVNTQVERTISYEKYPQSGADWYHKGTGIASNQGPGHYGEYDDEHVDLIRDQLLSFTYTAVDQIYDPTATQSMISNALNQGRSIITYCGHGSTTSWGTTGFSNTNVNALVNNSMLPFATSVACVNGNFANATCFGEAWLRATNLGEPTGCIGFWGSSISQSWNPPMYAQDEVIDLLTPELKNTFGGLCTNGAALMIDETGGSGENEADHWTIFGDPSLQVRTDTPFTMAVAHDNQIDPNNPTFEVIVTGIEGAMAAISWEGELFGSALTNAQGLASVQITPGTLPPGYVDLTVTAFNAMPYIVQLPVVSGGPDLWPPLIAHTPLENTTSSGPYTVEATIMDYSGVASASVWYSTDGSNFDEVAMVNTVGDTWVGDIPGQAVGATIDYYLEATDAAPAANTGTTDTYSFLILGILFSDDMESGIGGWTHEVVTPGWADQWHYSTENSHSPTHSWKFGDVGGNYADHAHGTLISPVISIGDACELTFWHRIQAEASGAYADSAYDGGCVEVSHNGGPWGILDLAYTHYIRAEAGGGNPYSGPFAPQTPVYSGSFNWTEVNADLAAYVGDIQLRFVFGSDDNTNNEGWYIDDVEIIGLPTGTTPEMTIELSYVSGSPIPATGGTLYYAIFGENVGSVPLDFDAWIELSYEGGPPETMILRSMTNYLPGWQINRPDAYFPVPESYAGGNYTMTGKVGIHPSVAWDQSSFDWQKAGAADANFVPWKPANVLDPFEEIITAQTELIIPDDFTFGGIYPNPFNPTTQFSFALPAASHVKLSVYNLRGQLVNTLVDGMRDAGTHDVSFDASNLASGIYLYRLSAGSNNISGKMVLVK
ncbi:hypothetical protein CEE37_02555 [candidate division LCP-89 bacterium B3_LCP]|uniref:Gingipain R n=1 Tax=candidate division LCP-89 bacterium B3_LCP TaxID=2012998 RepID=A0A532V2K8_UNCL8|nr:MAG: hypothetical protein CEE37_02555 [candidate division LCP-89 bacterium B3_LCP]